MEAVHDRYKNLLHVATPRSYHIMIKYFYKLRFDLNVISLQLTYITGHIPVDKHFTVFNPCSVVYLYIMEHRTGL